MNIWIVIGAVAAVAAIPFGVIVLVSIASLSEEAAQSLGRQAPGTLQRMARRLLGYRSEAKPAPRPASRVERGPAPRPGYRRSPARQPLPARQPMPEVRFAHARRPGSAPDQLAAVRQPRPGALRLDERETAGV